MTSRLRDDTDDLAGLCAAAADWYAKQGRRITAEILEKDYWVTEALRVLAEPRVHPGQSKGVVEVTARAVFKGGTSLSKAYHLIDRFSEDIDVYLVVGSVGAGVGNGRADTIMKNTAQFVADAMGLTSDPGGYPRKGTKRDYTFGYIPVTPVLGGLNTGVKLELVRMGHPTPNHPHRIQSLLADYAAATGALPLSEFAELEPFDIDVLAPERTLVDKLCILHAAGTKFAADPGWEMRQLARHYYDVYCLLDSPSVQESLAADRGLVAKYADAAAKDSEDVRRPGVPRPATGFQDSPAFSDRDVLGHAKTEYAREMAALAFAAVPEFEAVVALVRDQVGLL